ncbi:MAG: ABC transporter substrate-binding protein [Campylobacterales bacterium]
MKSIIKIIIILILNIVSVYAINYKDNVTIQLQWKHQFQFFGIGRSSLVLEKLHHKDILLVAAILQNSPFILLAKKKDDLKSITDLKNKKIMLIRDAVDMSSINIMLQVNGISSNDYFIQQHTFNVQDLVDNKIDVIAVYISNEPYFLQKKNIPYIIFDPKDYGFDFYDDILFTTSSYMKKHPKIVDAFYTASIKGWEYAFSHIDETAKFIFDNYNTQNKSLEHLIYEGQELKKLAYNKTDKLGTIDKKTIMKLIDVYKLTGYIIEEDISLDNFIYAKAFKLV